jgi:hypothetical protein
MGTAHYGLAEKSKDIDMSVASLARAHLGTIMVHVAPGLPLKSAIPRVAARIGLNVRRVRALWNREARAILHADMEALERELARIAERELTTGLMKNADRLEGYASRLALSNPELHREEIARLRRRAHLVRGVLASEEA